MKRIITIIICLITIIPCFAQRDIKVFNWIGRDRIIEILGIPDPKVPDDSEWLPELDFLRYKNTVIEIYKDSGEISRFITSSPEFCILSDYVPGGFKVGDPVSKLKSFDFAKSKYGRNDPGNALKRMNSAGEWYVAYQKEYYFITFKIENNRISKIIFHASEDLPYEGYKNPYSPW
jgi:hypothetical protein